MADIRRLRTEARARIHWGHDADGVYRWLRANGLTEPEARELLDEAVEARAVEVRRRAVGDLVIGGSISAVLLLLALWLASWPRVPVRGLGALAVVAAYSLFRLGRGIHGMVTGRADGSLTSYEE